MPAIIGPVIRWLSMSHNPYIVAKAAHCAALLLRFVLPPSTFNLSSQSHLRATAVVLLRRCCRLLLRAVPVLRCAAVTPCAAVVCACVRAASTPQTRRWRRGSCTGFVKCCGPARSTTPRAAATRTARRAACPSWSPSPSLVPPCPLSRCVVCSRRYAGVGFAACGCNERRLPCCARVPGYGAEPAHAYPAHGGPHH